MKHFSLLFFILASLFLPTHSRAQQDSLLNTSRVGCLSGDCEKGIGTYRNSAGSVYTGPFSEGKFEGKGKMIFRDGDVYEGDFQRGPGHRLGGRHRRGVAALSELTQQLDHP